MTRAGIRRPTCVRNLASHARSSCWFGPARSLVAGRSSAPGDPISAWSMTWPAANWRWAGSGARCSCTRPGRNSANCCGWWGWRRRSRAWTLSVRARPWRHRPSTVGTLAGRRDPAAQGKRSRPASRTDDSRGRAADEKGMSPPSSRFKDGVDDNAVCRPDDRSGMSRVRVLVGTRKGAFVLTADGQRRHWQVDGPYFGGWEVYHVKGSAVDPDRLYASQSTSGSDSSSSALMMAGGRGRRSATSSSTTG